jgi:hypothetical protein
VSLVESVGCKLHVGKVSELNDLWDRQERSIGAYKLVLETVNSIDVFLVSEFHDELSILRPPFLACCWYCHVPYSVCSTATQ